MSHNPDKFLRQALELARQMTILADEGEADCTDDGCAVFFGIIRDCAYKIKGRAVREREIHASMQGRKTVTADGQKKE